MKTIKPIGERLIVKELAPDKYETRDSGLILETVEEFDVAQNTMRAEIKQVGDYCKIFTQESVGTVVVIHEYAGTKYGRDLRIINELDVQAYESE